METPEADLSLMADAEKLRLALKEMSIQLYGDGSLSKREFETEAGLFERMEGPIWNMWNATSAPTKTAMDNYLVLGKEFEEQLKAMRGLEQQLDGLEKQLNDMGAPFTSGRNYIPDWKLD